MKNGAKKHSSSSESLEKINLKRFLTVQQASFFTCSCGQIDSEKGSKEHRSSTDSLQINHFEEISQCPADLSFESISYSHFLEVIDGSILRNIF